MKKSIDIICECGHEKKFHKEVGAPIWDGWCTSRKKGEAFIVELYEGKTPYYTCMCPRYVPDNLLHVEKLAKRKKLI